MQQRLALLRIRQLELVETALRIQQRLQRAATKRPQPCRAGEQAGKRGAGDTAGAGERNGGEQIRLGDAHLRVRGHQILFGFAQIGSALQQAGRQPGRRHRRCALAGGCLQRRQRRTQDRIRVVPEQHTELVLCQPDLASQLGQIGLCYRQLPHGCSDIQFRHGATIVLRAGEIDELLARGDSAIGDLQLLVECLQREVIGGHAGHQSCDHVLPGKIRLQQLGACRFGRAAVFAPEIDLVRQTAFQLEHITDLRGAGQRFELRTLRPFGACRHRELRQLLQARRAQDGARLIDARCGNANIEVVGQRLADQLLQARILVDLPPALVGQRGGVGAAGEAVIRRSPGVRPPVVRTQLAAGQQQARGGCNRDCDRTDHRTVTAPRRRCHGGVAEDVGGGAAGGGDVSADLSRGAMPRSRSDTLCIST